ITAPSITETNANQSVNFTVNSSNAVQGGFTLADRNSGVKAKAGNGCNGTTTKQKSFTGPANENQNSAVTNVSETIVERNETFTITLGAATGGSGQAAGSFVPSGSAATGTMNNDDSTTLTITAPSITETNANQSVNFTVNSSNAVQGGFTL